MREIASILGFPFFFFFFDFGVTFSLLLLGFMIFIHVKYMIGK